ncbi:unnamed protein product [Protopolystoma xenopodis]|uniref:Uncharacterized protein n=1 Tax=Protopolystoma xenopodis TaxID=117903 RepID=A0A3S5AV87_9PLAT|nr:unnamed protein product [Protopolystoma xenopodis]
MKGSSSCRVSQKRSNLLHVLRCHRDHPFLNKHAYVYSLRNQGITGSSLPILNYKSRRHAPLKLKRLFDPDRLFRGRMSVKDVTETPFTRSYPLFQFSFIHSPSILSSSSSSLASQAHAYTIAGTSSIFGSTGQRLDAENRANLEDVTYPDLVHLSPDRGISSIQPIIAVTTLSPPPAPPPSTESPLHPYRCRRTCQGDELTRHHMLALNQSSLMLSSAL